MDEHMQLNLHRSPPLLVISLEGKLDTGACAEFETEMQRALSGGDRLILMDCERLAFIASAGLRVFLMAAKQLRTSGGKLAFAGLQRHVEQVFQISGFTALFQIHKTRAEGEKALAAHR
jgi:anti-sigma B factor antagonist